MWQVCVYIPSLLLLFLFLFLIFPFSLTKEGVHGLVSRYLPDFTGADEMRDKKLTPFTLIKFIYFFSLSLELRKFHQAKGLVKELLNLKRKARWLPRSTQPWLHEVSGSVSKQRPLWDKGRPGDRQNRRMRWTFQETVSTTETECLSQRSEQPCYEAEWALIREVS